MCLILAHAGKPRTLADFRGKVIHSSEYGDAAPWKDPEVPVVSSTALRALTSADDIAAQPHRPSKPPAAGDRWTSRLDQPVRAGG